MLSIKVKSIVPLRDMQLLVFFENGVIRKFDVKPIMKDYPEYQRLQKEELFNSVRVEPGGYGISWNEDLDCSEGELWENGVEIPLNQEDFECFIKYNTVISSEAAELLNCSRQNIDAYVKRGKITPIKDVQRTKLFIKSEVLRLKNE